MNSMTGFGRGAASAEGRAVQVEISTVNRKNLDVHLSVPGELSGLEASIRKRVADGLGRGRAQIRIGLDAGKATRMEFDAAEAGRFLTEVNTFAEQKGLRPMESVKDLLRLPGVFQEKGAEPPSKELAEAVDRAVTEALSGVRDMRAAEGAQLRQRLEEQLVGLADVVGRIEPLMESAREERGTKLRAAAEGVGGLEPEMRTRVLQEIALFGEKTDVREEVDRLRAHVVQAREKLAAEGPVGRGLDFICQELAREFTTLGVKAARTDLNRIALEGKERVETLREQVQNVE